MSDLTNEAGSAVPSLAILVADDDASHRLLAISALRHALAGMYEPRFAEAATGDEAVERIEQGGIDLVLLDYEIPGKNGLEVLALLQNRPVQVPVVLLTASNEREVMLEAMRRGATDFLAKDEMSRARLAHVVRGSIQLARLRADLARGQKMAAIGTLAGGIAHEFNNILQIILGHSQHAINRDDPERWLKALRYCNDAADKGARIVRQLLTFARKNSTMRARFRLDRAVAEAIQMEEEAARRDGVKINLVLNGRPNVMGDLAQLTQVIAGLLSNARHACTAMVTTRAQLTPSVTVTVDSEGRNARVSVSDNGIGIEPEDMPRLFEPFFTTKGSLGGRIYDGKSSGTGLELAIASSVVSAHEGRIDVTSRPGEGSTFTIVLPAGPRTGQHLPPPETTGRILSGESMRLDKVLHGKSILIVDDEELIGELLANYLTEKGLQCDMARNTADARAALSARDYDLLLFDLTLPDGESGLSLLQECRQQGGPNAAAPALAMTGHGADDEHDEKLFTAGFRGIVRKPFEVREIGKLVASTLRATATE